MQNTHTKGANNMDDKFEIHLNGMVYVFDSEKTAEIMDLLDSMADEAYSE